jgi:Ran GTPase-activating protein (RanGAP) involved in mRNA processing and transport
VSLSRLDVSGNLLCGVSLDGYGREEGTYDATGLIALAKSISNLKELNISDNRLKAEGAKILVPALKANGALVSLNLAKNDLGVEGAQHVAGVLPKW